MIKLKNYAYSTLANDITSTATQIQIVSGEETRFPALDTSVGEYFYATIVDANNPNKHEIVKVTKIEGNTFTVVRAQENTNAQGFSAGDKFELRLTARTLYDYVIQFGGGDLFDYISETDPTIDTNPSRLGATWFNKVTGVIWVCKDNTTNHNAWKPLALDLVNLQFDSDTIKDSDNNPILFDYIKNTNPTYNTNPASTNATWLNNSTGVIFVCVDNTIDANVWVPVSINTVNLQYDGETIKDKNGNTVLYDYIKDTDPDASVNPSNTGVTWFNRSTGTAYICTDNTANANVWDPVYTSNSANVTFDGDKLVDENNQKILYDYIKSTDPSTSVNPSTAGATWFNNSTGVAFVCVDNTTDANVWKEIPTYLLNIKYDGSTVVDNEGSPILFDYISDVAPSTSVNPTNVNVTWYDRSSGTVYICVDNAVDANVWVPVSIKNVNLSFDGVKIVDSNGNKVLYDYISDDDPNTSVNPSTTDVYWYNRTTGMLWKCTDNTTDANVWTKVNDTGLSAGDRAVKLQSNSINDTMESTDGVIIFNYVSNVDPSETDVPTNAGVTWFNYATGVIWKCINIDTDANTAAWTDVYTLQTNIKFDNTIVDSSGNKILYDYIATGAPAADVNPSSVGATWYDISTGVLYRCADNTVDANVWEKFTVTTQDDVLQIVNDSVQTTTGTIIVNYIKNANPTISDVPNNVGDIWYNYVSGTYWKCVAIDNKGTTTDTSDDEATWQKIDILNTNVQYGSTLEDANGNKILYDYISDSDPTATVNPLSVGATWFNRANGTTWKCTDNTTDANVWVQVGGGASSASQVQFTPLDATNIYSNQATIGVDIQDFGDSTTTLEYRFVYGTDSANLDNATDWTNAQSVGPKYVTITNLTGNTTYYYKAEIRDPLRPNSLGVVESPQKTFVTTNLANNIDNTTFIDIKSSGGTNYEPLRPYNIVVTPDVRNNYNENDYTVDIVNPRIPTVTKHYNQESDENDFQGLELKSQAKPFDFIITSSSTTEVSIIDENDKVQAGTKLLVKDDTSDFTEVTVSNISAQAVSVQDMVTKYNYSSPFKYIVDFERQNPFKETSTTALADWEIIKLPFDSGNYSRTFIVGDKVYLIQGAGTIYKGIIAQDTGDITGWTQDTSNSFPVKNCARVIRIGDNVYHIGANSTDSMLHKTPLDSDGNITSVVYESVQPPAIHAPAVWSVGDKIYMAEGYNYNDDTSHAFYSADITSTGFQNWTKLGDLPETNGRYESFVTKSRIYLMGSYGNANNKLYYANINPDGSIGAWTLDRNLTVRTYYQPNAIVTKNRVFLIDTSGYIYCADIDDNGIIGNFYKAGYKNNVGIGAGVTSLVTKNFLFVFAGQYLFKVPFDGWDPSESYDLYLSEKTVTFDNAVANVPTKVTIKPKNIVVGSSINTGNQSIVIDRKNSTNDTIVFKTDIDYELSSSEKFTVVEAGGTKKFVTFNVASKTPYTTSDLHYDMYNNTSTYVISYHDRPGCLNRFHRPKFSVDLTTGWQYEKDAPVTAGRVPFFRIKDKAFIISSDTVYMAPIYENGDIGDFASVQSGLSLSTYLRVLVTKNYVYMFDLYNKKTYEAQMNADGTLTNFIDKGLALPYIYGFVWSNDKYMFFAGGWWSNEIYYTALDGNGQITGTSWTKDGTYTLPDQVILAQHYSNADDYLTYLFGGQYKNPDNNQTEVWDSKVSIRYDNNTGLINQVTGYNILTEFRHESIGICKLGQELYTFGGDFNDTYGKTICKGGLYPESVVGDHDIPAKILTDPIVTINKIYVLGDDKKIYSHEFPGWNLPETDPTVLAYKYTLNNPDTTLNKPVAIYHGDLLEVDANITYDANTDILTLDSGVINFTENGIRSISVGIEGVNKIIEIGPNTIYVKQ